MSEKILPYTDANFEGYHHYIIYAREILMDLFMTFGPSLNYLFQVKKFKKTHSSKGFSNSVCLVTVLSHTLKIFFWFGKKFKYTLLIQSILVIIMQLYLIYLVIKFREETNEELPLKISEPLTKSKKEKIRKIIQKDLLNWSETLNRKLIWKWNNVIEYYKFYFFIIFILIAFSLSLGIKNVIYINIIGSISIIMEILCSLPQIIEMRKSKNQRNISKIMVLMWFSGNILKIYYNMANHSPMQLIIGSFAQVFFNCILIGQIAYYYKLNKKESLSNSGEIKFIDESESETETESEDSQKDLGKFKLISGKDEPNSI